MAAFADGASVIFTPDIRNFQGNSLTIKIEHTAKPGRAPSGSRPGPVPGAKHVALDGSVISAGKLHDMTVDGDLTYSVCVKSHTDTSTHSEGCEDPVDEAPPSSEESAVKFIRDHMITLISCLRADLYILQFVFQEGIVSKRQYDILFAIQQPEKTVTRLINMVIDGGQKSCHQFLELLKVPEVVENYPKLADIMAK